MAEPIVKEPMREEPTAGEPTVAGPQRKRRTKLSKIERRCLLVTCVCGLLLLGAPLWWRLQSGSPTLVIPTPVLPNPNAFDFYVRAGNAISNTSAISNAIYAIQEPLPASQRRKKTTAFLPPMPGVPNNAGPPPVAIERNYSEAEKAALVEENAGVLQTLRQGFAFPYLHPPVRSSAATFPYYATFRQLARLLALEAQVKAARGDWSGAAQSGLDGIRLGSDIPRGAPFIGALVGIACEAIGREELWKSVEHLDAAQARAAARRLEALIARRVSHADILQEEKWTGQASLVQIFRAPDWKRQMRGLWGGGSTQDWRLRLHTMLISKQKILDNFTRGMDALIANARLPYAAPKTPPPTPGDPLSQILLPVFSHSHWNFARNETSNTLLLAALALRAYRLEHGSYPPSLAALAPAYLKQVPADPLALKGALRYKRTGDKYLLYSVGPDGRDDGGKPIQDPRYPGARRQYYMVQPDSRGDMVAGLNR